MKNTLTILILTTITLFSCRKETVLSEQQNTVDNHLKIYSGYKEPIKINQAVIIYDSTEIKDSIDFIVPPTDKYYEWKVTPDNGCDSIVGDNNKGMIEFIFHCSGTYSITAKVFDSSTHNFIGNTDALEVTVTTETLYPTQPIEQDDVLNIKPGIVKRGTIPHDPSLPWDEIDVELLLLTNNLYDYYTPYI